MRRLSPETVLYHSVVHIILRKNLKVVPYQVQSIQGLARTDLEKRLSFCTNLIARNQDNSDFFDEQLLLTEKAHFSLSNTVSRQSFQFGDKENLKKF